jgi:hypothetical protein
LRACSRSSNDVLLVSSGNDEILPATNIRSFFLAFDHAASIAHHVIEDADHALSERAYEVAYERLVFGWLREHFLGHAKRQIMAAALVSK